MKFFKSPATQFNIQHLDRRYYAVLLILIGLLLTTGWVQAIAEDTPRKMKQQIKLDELERIYLPLSELDTILQLDRQGVLLPRKEFESLYQSAKEKMSSDVRQPEEIILSKGTYRAVLKEKELSITASLTFRQFGEGWQIYPLEFSGLAVVQATLDGKPAQLGRNSQQHGRLLLFNNRAGLHELELKLSAHCTSAGSDLLASLHLARSSTGIFSLSLPDKKHLFVNGMKIEQPPVQQNQADYQIAIGGKRQIELRISDKQEQQEADSLLFASTAHGLYASPGEVTWRAVTQLQVFGRTVDRLRLEVPKTLEIVDVQSTGLDMWELADSTENPSNTEIVLFYRQPFRGNRQIVLRGVMTTTEGSSWQAPPLTIKKATSHVGRLLIGRPAAVRLKLENQQGTRQVMPKADNLPVGLPRDLATKDLLAFDIWQEDFELKLMTQTRQRELHVASSTLFSINQNGLDCIFTSNLETVFAPLFQLNITLPAEWTVSEVQVGGELTRWQTIPQQAGEHLLQISLKNPLTPGSPQQLTLKAHRNPEQWPPAADPIEIEFPEVALPQAGVVEGTYAIAGDDNFELIPIETVGLDMAKLKGAALGYRYQDSSFTGLLEVVRKPTELAVQTYSSTRLDPETLQSHVELWLSVTGGTLSSLDVVLPENVQQDLRFSVLGGTRHVVEQQALDPVNNEQTWRLQFDHPFRGELKLAVDLSLSRDADQPEDEPFLVPHVRVPAAERQNGFIALEASHNQELKIVASGHDGLPLRHVDRADLPLSRYQPRERVIAVYRYFVPGYQVSLKAQRFARAAVPTAICNAGEHHTLLGNRGETQHRFQYTFQSVGVQNLQIQLPAYSQLWSVLLDNQPVEVRSQSDILLVPLTESSSLNHTVEIYLSTSDLSETAAGQLQQRPPVLAVLDGTGQSQPLEILDQRWTLHYPASTTISQSDGLFTPEQMLIQVGLLARLRDAFHFVPSQQLLWQSGAVALAVLLILITIRAYHRWKMLGLVGIGFGFLFFFCLFMLLPTVQYSKIVALQEGAQIAHDSDYANSQSGGVGGGFGGSTNSAPHAAESAPFDQPAEAMESELDGVNRPAKPQSLSEFSDGFRKRESEGKSPRQPGNQAQQAVPSPKSTQHPNAVPGLKTRNLDEKEDKGFSMPPPLPPVAGPGEGVLPMQSRRGAVLGVPVHFEPTGNLHQMTFRYSGHSSHQEDLQVQYENRHHLGNFFWAVLAGTVLAFWMIRSLKWQHRLALFLAGLIVPLAGFTFVPGTGVALFDGLFFGTVTALVLTLLIQIVWFCCRCCQSIVSLKRASTAVGLLLAYLVGTSSVSLAQQQALQQPAPNAPPRMNRRAEINSYLKRPATQQAKQPSLFFPYAPETDPLSAKQVFVPQQVFRAMWDATHPEDRMKTSAPAKGIVAGASYSGQLSTQANASRPRVKITGRFVLYSYRSSSISLELPLGKIAFQSAKIDGEEAVIVAGKKRGDPPLSIIVNRPGLHLLDVMFELPVKPSGEAGEFEVPLKAVAAGQFAFQLPQSDFAARINGGSGQFRRTTVEQTTTIAVPINQGGNLKIAWQPKQAENDTNIIMHSDSTHRVNIGDVGITMQSDFDFRVHQGSTEELRFVFPPNVKLRSITGKEMSGWELNEKEGQQLLTLFLRKPLTKQAQFSFQLYLSDKLTQKINRFTVPQLIPQQVTRDIGKIGVFTEPQFQVQGTAEAGVSQINSSQFNNLSPANKQQQHLPQLAYRFIRRPFKLTLAAQRPKTDMRGRAEHLVMVGRNKLHLGSHINISSAEVPQSRYVIQLPDQFILHDVQAKNLLDWYIDRQPGTRENQRLIVELSSPQTGDIVLNGNMPYEAYESELPLSLPLPVAVDRLKSELLVQFQESVNVKVAQLGNWKPQPPQSVSSWLQQGIQPAHGQNRSAHFAFSSSHLNPGTITFETARPAPQFSAASVTLLTITDTFQHYSFNFKWEITAGEVDTLSFIAPAELNDKLQFRAEGLRQVLPEELEDGRTRWVISLDDPVDRSFFLLATAMLPPAAADEIAAPSFEMESYATLFEEEVDEDASRVNQQHFVVLVNQSDNQLSTIRENGLQLVDAGELPISLPETLLDQSAEILKLTDNKSTVAWRIQRFTEKSSAPATISLADLTTMLAEDGSWRTTVRYQTRNHSRQFMAVSLPENSRLLSLFVRGKPVHPAKQNVPIQLGQKKALASVLLIPLPHTSAVDPSFEVKLVLAGTLEASAVPRKSKREKTTIDLPAPRVLSRKLNDNFGIPVSRTSWSLHAPNRYEFDLIEDRSRTNLNESTLEDVAAYRLISLVNDMNMILDNSVSLSSSLRLKSKAKKNINNLRTLGLSLHNYHRETTNQAGQQASEALQNTIERASKLASPKIPIAEYFSKQSNGVNNEESINLKQFDEQGQQQILGEQSKQLYGLNSLKHSQADSSKQQDDLEKSLQMNLKRNFTGKNAYRGRVRIRKPSEKTAGKPAQKKGGTKASQSDSRTFQRHKSEQQLDELLLNQQESVQQKQQRKDPFDSNLPDQPGRQQNDAGKLSGNNELSQRWSGDLSEGGALGAGTTWQGQGGMSLPIDLPVAGNAFSFSKTGGNPKLAFHLRPKSVRTSVLKITWSVIWGIAGILLVLATLKAKHPRALLGTIPWGFVTIGLLMLFTLPGILSITGFLLFFCGASVVGAQRALQKPA